MSLNIECPSCEDPACRGDPRPRTLQKSRKIEDLDLVEHHDRRSATRHLFERTLYVSDTRLLRRVSDDFGHRSR